MEERKYFKTKQIMEIRSHLKCSRILLFKVWSVNQQNQPHLGAGWKSRILGPTPELLNQSAFYQDPQGICVPIRT